jgi:hypothetical protein
MMKSLILLAIFAFFGGSSAFTIDCLYYMDGWPVIDSVYQCTVQNLQHQANHTVTGVTGTHIAGMTNDDVGLVRIIDNYNVDFIPRGLTSFFPNLRGFRSEHSSIDTLHGDEFDEYGEKFIYLTIHYSNLTTISSRIFDHTPNVGLVDVFGSMIERVGHDLFTPVNATGLTWVDFSRTNCINEFSTTPEGIQTLIGNLQVQCPFDDEEPPMTTTEGATTTTTVDNETSTSGSHSCDVGNIYDFVCDLQDGVGRVQADLNDSRNELQLELNESNRRIKALEDEVEWMRDELLRLIGSPCACK